MRLNLHKICFLVLFTFSSQLTLSPVLHAGQPPMPMQQSTGAQPLNGIGQQSAKYAVTPLIGTIATGISLLIAYGPQIIAMAQTLLVIGVAVMQVANASGSIIDLITQAISKIRGVVNIAVGPLAAVNGVAKEQSTKIQKSLLSMTGSLTKEMDKKVEEENIKDPGVEKIIKDARKTQKEAEKLVAVTKEGEKIGARLEDISLNVSQNLRDLSKKLGELQEVGQKGSTLTRNIGNSAGKIRKELFNARLNAMTTSNIMGDIQQQIQQQLNAGGMEISPTLKMSEIGLNPAIVADRVNNASNAMKNSASALQSAAVENGDLHIQIMESLNDLRSTLLKYARNKGVPIEEVLKKANEKDFREQTLARAAKIQAEDNNFSSAGKRIKQNLAELEEKIQKTSAQKGAKTNDEDGNIDINALDETKFQEYIDGVYAKKVAAYQNYLLVQGNPDSQKETINREYTKYLKLQKEYDNLLIIQYHRFKR
ncbi:hypothetical protein ACFL35_01095 [Candidatus Riflebacteria bacterium]